MNTIFNTLFITLFFFFFNFGANAQDFEHSWAFGFGNSDYNEATEIVTDDVGNVYIVGQISDSIDFDPGFDEQIMFFEDTVSYIQKLNEYGELIWIKTIDANIVNIKIDEDDRIVLSGNFTGIKDFNLGSGTSEMNAENGGSFLLKLDANGTFIWSKQFGVNGSCTIRHTVVDYDNNWYVVGEFSGSPNFNTGVGDDSLSVNNGRIFILKTNALGEFEWVKQMDGIVSIQGVKSDLFGSIFLTGSFTLSCDFDLDVNEHIVSATGFSFSDAFILKLNVDGEFQWVRTFGNNLIDIGFDITTDFEGNCIATGVFHGEVDFDPSSDSTILNAHSSTNQFVVKYNDLGEFQWAKSIESPMGNSNSGGTLIRSDFYGDIYAVGYFLDSIDIDPGSAEMILDPGEGRDIFIQKINGNGEFEWAKQIGNQVSTRAIHIAIDNYRNFYTLGYFKNTLSFEGSSQNIISSDHKDIFVQRIQPCYSEESYNATSCFDYEWINGAIYNESTTLPKIVFPNGAANGCDSIVRLNLEITGSSVDLSTQVNGQTISSNASGVSYQWLNCNDDYSVIQNETQSSFTSNIQGYFAVEISDNDCIDTSECIYLETIGLVEEESNALVSIVPNPSSSNVVTLYLYEELEFVIIKLFDNLGKELSASYYQNAKEIEFKLNSNSGLYYVEIDCGNGKLIRKKLLKL
ncbi:MAG: T9SS type A sorting domain-containing protein [Flavobacteriales bacterium]